MSELEEAIAERAAELTLEEATGSGLRWAQAASLSSLVMALVAAVGGLLAGVSANEALGQRTAALIDLSRQQAQTFALELAETQHRLRTALGGSEVDAEERAELVQQKREAQALTARLEAELASNDQALALHERFAIAVTVLSVGISLCGIALAVRRRWLWFGALGFAGIGVAVTGLGVVGMLG